MKLTLLDLSDRPGKEAESRQKLSDLASEYPKRPEPQSALWYLAWRGGDRDAAVKAFAAADAPRLFQLLAFATLQNGDTAAARANALRWRENAKEADERERASRFLEVLDGSNRVESARTATPASAPPPAETKQASAAASAGVELPSIQGAFTELDCSGAPPRVVLQTSEGRVSLLMDDPGRVRISGLATDAVDLHCGPQKPAAVSAQYEPAGASRGDVKGRVRAIRFEPEPGTPGKK